jgi:hypothetical protein
MNTTNQLPLTSAPKAANRASSTDAFLDEAAQLRRQLLKSEIRLAKARATVAGAEAEVRVYTARLKAFTKDNS